MHRILPTKSAIRQFGKGSYILILYLASGKRIQIGKLGEFQFPRGYYAYVGSALGPGGLSGRIGHHLTPSLKPRWHVDYLRMEAILEEVWIKEAKTQLEHCWASMLSHRDDVMMPSPGFGSSDCKCNTHLFFFKQRPQFAVF